MVEKKQPLIDILRLFTAPLVAITGALVTVLLWVYNIDREDNKQFQKVIYERMDTGFREIATEFKSVRQDEAEYRQKTDASLASVIAKMSICCHEKNYGREKITDSIYY